MARNQQVLINGKAFSAADMSILVAGISLASISSLTITETQEKTNNKGFSDEPVSRGRSGKEYECSMDIAYKDVIKLRNLTPTGSLLDVPMFEILGILDNGSDISRIRVKSCEFTNDGLEVSEGDTEIKRTFDLIIAGIDRS